MNTDTIICNLYETRTKLGYTQRQVAEGTSITDSDGKFTIEYKLS